MKLLRIPGRQRGERGATQVEFALTLVTVMLVMFWTWELCMLVYTYTVMANAAKEGVRYGQVRSADGANLTANVTAQVQDFARYSLHDTSSISVTVSYPDGSATPPNRIRVQVTYVYIPYISVMVPPPTIKAFATGRMMY